MYNRSWVTSKCMNYRRSQNYRTTEDLRISHPKKGTLHQIDFYLILTLGSRNGLGYSVVLWYSIKKIIIIITIIMIIIIIILILLLLVITTLIIIIIIITAVVVVVLIRFCKILLVVVLIHNHLPAKGKRW